MKISWKLILFLLCAKFTLIFQAAAAIHTYPGSAPCDSLLQYCIDAVEDGDVIQLATPVIDENIIINKSLVLIPAPGLPAPLLGAGSVPRTLLVQDGGAGAPPINVLVTQLNFNNASFIVNLDEGTGRHNVELNNSIINSSSNGVSVSTNVEAYITIRNNTISSVFKGILAITNLPASTFAVISILANRINSILPASSTTGIQILNGGSGLTYDNIHSNVIHSVSLGGISIFAVGSSTSHVRVTNNTLDDIQASAGIYVPLPPLNTVLNVSIYNNIVTRSGLGLFLPSFTSGLSVSNGFNDFWANTIDADWGGYSQGPNTIFSDPMYFNINSHNYLLVDGSPCLEAGTSDPGPGILPLVDVQNFPRVFGAAVDIGAHEKIPVAGYGYYALDDFSDGLISPFWSYPKGNWIEDGSRLVGMSERKALALDYSHAGASILTIEAEMMAEGNSSSGTLNKISLLGWYQDKDNHVQLLMNEQKNRWILKQRQNGVVVNKAKLGTTIRPFVSYRVKLTYDGSNFNFYIDDFLHLTMPASGTPSGIEGFQVKGVGRFGDVYVY